MGTSQGAEAASVASADAQGYRLSRYQWLALISAFLGWMFDSMDLNLFTLVLVPSVSQLLHSTDATEISKIGSYIIAVKLLTWGIGGVLFGVAADRFGRSRVMGLTILIYAAFTLLSAFAKTWPQLAVAQAMAGFGIGGEWAAGAAPALVAVFLLMLIPAGMGSMALYQAVAEWSEEMLSPGHMSEGLFGVALGSVVAAVWGGFSTIAYLDNIGILRATRVGSRFVTLAAGILLIVLVGCVKFDMLIVVVPIPVISAAATLLFGLVFMHGVHILAQVEWDDRRLITSGLAFLVGLGGLFISPEVIHAMPLMLQLVLQQPVISGGLTLVILHSLLCSRQEAANAPSAAPSRTQNQKPDIG